jgi:hypothetical protein
MHFAGKERGTALLAHLMQQPLANVERDDDGAALERLPAEPAGAAADIQQSQAGQVVPAEQLVEDDLQPSAQIVRIGDAIERVGDRIVEVQARVAEPRLVDRCPALAHRRRSARASLHMFQETSGRRRSTAQ